MSEHLQLQFVHEIEKLTSRCMRKQLISLRR